MKRTRRMNRRRRSGRHGFTLMEVLLVLAILVILGSLVVANFSGIFASSKIRSAEIQIAAFESQLEYYMVDVGTYPSSQQGLQALREQPADLVDPTKWRGPYSKKDIPKDPWSNDYQYQFDGGSIFEISSAGPDGQGGTDDDVIRTSG